MTPDLKRRGMRPPRSLYYHEPPIVFTIEQLQFKQRKGETLTPDDKERIKKFAETQRKKNLSRKK